MYPLYIDTELDHEGELRLELDTEGEYGTAVWLRRSDYDKIKEAFEDSS